jgi:hypothetical protein
MAGHKRKTRDIPIFIDTNDKQSTEETTKQLIQELITTVDLIKWNYKRYPEEYQLRDKAISSVFIMSGLRNGEAAQGPEKTWGWKKNQKTKKKEYISYQPNSYPLQRKQVRVYTDRIIILNCQTVKNGDLRPEITLTKKGSFALLTQIVEKWINLLDSLGATEESYLFPSASHDRKTSNGAIFDLDKPLSTKRIHWIIKTTSNKFPHWFRAVNETLYGRVIFKNDPWKLKQRMGLKTIEATAPYVQGSYKEDEKTIERL